MSLLIFIYYYPFLAEEDTLTYASISISGIDTACCNDLLVQTNLKLEIVDYKAPQSTKKIKPYSWTKDQESAQIDRCLNWMAKSISLPDGLAFNNLSSKHDALSLPTGSYLNFTVKGTADALITDKHFVGDTY